MVQYKTKDEGAVFSFREQYLEIRFPPNLSIFLLRENLPLKEDPGVLKHKNILTDTFFNVYQARS